MSIYIIGDLHLSFSQDKPMSIFGPNWEEHTEKIKKDWKLKVNNEDTVILAGDFSWATYIEDTYEDFSYINSLPGKKIILKGNHDYWWTTLSSMKRYLEEKDINNVDFLYNNSFEIEGKIIVGTRGWAFTDTENSQKMLNREMARLELSIKNAIQKYGDEKEIIAIMHYPPISNSYMKNEYTYNSVFLDIMKKYNIKKCFYGHLHGSSHKDAIEGNIDGIEFKLISADYLDFKLCKIIDK
ncbi:MAG: serine/threonine protein phosphatase [Clostridiaceae bacterium]|nr:serine/threonine protein phosphatase [Clostridiaceae bacterium]